MSGSRNAGWRCHARVGVAWATYSQVTWSAMGLPGSTFGDLAVAMRSFSRGTTLPGTFDIGRSCADQLGEGADGPASRRL